MFYIIFSNIFKYFIGLRNAVAKISLWKNILSFKFSAVVEKIASQVQGFFLLSIEYLITGENLLVLWHYDKHIYLLEWFFIHTYIYIYKEAEPLSWR